MTDDLESTVGNGEERPSEDREDQNHGCRDNGPEPVPSAPPGTHPCLSETGTPAPALPAQ